MGRLCITTAPHCQKKPSLHTSSKHSSRSGIICSVQSPSCHRRRLVSATGRMRWRRSASRRSSTPGPSFWTWTSRISQYLVYLAKLASQGCACEYRARCVPVCSKCWARDILLSRLQQGPGRLARQQTMRAPLRDLAAFTPCSAFIRKHCSCSVSAQSICCKALAG